jgi:hypothetical protein
MIIPTFEGSISLLTLSTISWSVSVAISLYSWARLRGEAPARSQGWTGSVRKILTWGPVFPDKKIRTRRIFDLRAFSYKCFGEHPSSGVKIQVEHSLEPSRIPAASALMVNGKGLLILVERTAIDFSEKWHELTFHL